MMLAWGAKVSPEFREIVVRRSPEVGCDPSHLMACMAFETGRTFDPAKRNPLSTATGLIQFMASTAADLNTTTAALAAMSAEQQLDYVFRYLNRYRGRLGSLASLYMSILWPAAIDRADGDPLFARPSREYEANKGLDANGDGTVTKAEATAPVARLLAEGLRPENAAETEPTLAPIEDAGVPARPEDRIPQETSVAPIAFILPLLQSLFQVFTPLAQAKLTQTLNKQTNDPAMSGQMAQQILDIVKNAAGQAGVAPTPAITTTPADAALAAAQAVATVKANPALVAKAEADVLDYLDKMAPLLDRISAAEQAAWAAEDASRNAAAQRTAGAEWRSPTVIIAIAMLGLPYIAVTRVLFGGELFSEQLQTVVVTAAVTGILGYIGGYYFGTTRTSSANQQVMAEIAARRPNT